MAGQQFDPERVRARFVAALLKAPEGAALPDATELEVATRVLMLQLVKLYPPDPPGWRKPTLPKSSFEKIVDAGRRVACGQPTGIDIAAMAALPAAPLATIGSSASDFMVMAGEIARVVLPALGAFPRS